MSMVEEGKKMTVNEIAAQIRSGFFGDRETLQEAFEYAEQIARASDNPAAVMSAIMVVANTISKKLKEAQ